MTTRAKYWTAIVGVAFAFMGCSAPTDTPTATRDGSAAELARSGGAKPIVVSSANPAYGYQGESAKRVIITGSGFSAGAVVAWERNGVADPKVVVRNSVVLSSTQIEATIDIALDADLAFYDIAVTSDKGKGVGTESFEVTTAELLGTGTVGGASGANAVNDAGDAVGYSYVKVSKNTSQQMGFFYHAATNAMVGIGGGPGGCPGQPQGLDQSSRVIVGVSGGTTKSGCGWALAWTRASTDEPWPAATRLPHPPATSSSANAVAHVAAWNATVAVGGVSYSAGPRPSYWLLQDGSSTWSGPIELPFVGTGGRVRAASPLGVFAGHTDGPLRAAVWSADGTLTLLEAAAGTNGNCMVHELSPNAQYAVGECGVSGGNTAVYWTRAASGAWNAGLQFTPAAVRAWAVNDAGLAAGIDGLVWQIGQPGAIALSGLGDHGNASFVRGLSNTSPAILVGQATVNGGRDDRAVRWVQYWSSSP